MSGPFEDLRGGGRGWYRADVKKPAWVLLCAASLSGCAGTVNRFMLDDVVRSAASDADTGKACAMGTSLVHPLAAVNGNAHLALAVAEGVSAVCDQTHAWEADLTAARTKHNAAALGEGRAAEVIDAQLAARRLHARTAARFNRSFEQAQLAFGPIGQGCPTLSHDDQFVFVFVLVTGTLALLHDTAAGGAVGVPQDRLAAIARASTCVDDATWWHVPSALRGGAWVMVPGSGPSGTDGWKVLDDAATQGASSGVRVAVAIEALLAYNAGRTDVLQRSLHQHAQSQTTTKPNAAWLLLDTYASEISLHQSDLVWSEATGHRTEVFGRLPSDHAAVPATTPFEGDPFSTP